jgi:hypothetical protein
MRVHVQYVQLEIILRRLVQLHVRLVHQVNTVAPLDPLFVPPVRSELSVKIQDLQHVRLALQVHILTLLV